MAYLVLQFLLFPRRLDCPRAVRRTSLYHQKKIARLEAKLETMKHETEQDKTAVMGGLQGFGGEKEARAWVDEILWELYCPRRKDTYFKGGEFKDMLFLKFTSKDDRDEAIDKFNKHKATAKDDNIWMGPDLPLEQRAVKSFLFGLRKKLVENKLVD